MCLCESHWLLHMTALYSGDSVPNCLEMLGQIYSCKVQTHAVCMSVCLSISLCVFNLSIHACISVYLSLLPSLTLLEISVPKGFFLKGHLPLKNPFFCREGLSRVPCKTKVSIKTIFHPKKPFGRKSSSRIVVIPQQSSRVCQGFFVP